MPGRRVDLRRYLSVAENPPEKILRGGQSHSKTQENEKNHAVKIYRRIGRKHSFADKDFRVFLSGRKRNFISKYELTNSQ